MSPTSTPDEKVSILLVDDQQNNVFALESILADMGENLVTADSGKKALKQLLDREFAVILLDVQMPELDGFETAHLIRQRDKSKDTPIIFLTALSRSETNVFRGYELGAVDYIFKPFHPEILRSKVNVFVQLFKQREAIKRQAQELVRLSKQTELILNAAAEGVFGINTSGATTFVNPAAARMIAVKPTDIIGQDMHAVVHPSFPGVATCDPSTCPLYAVVHGAFNHDEVESTFFRTDGTSFPVEFTASPLRDEDSKALGSVITFRDVTEKRAALLAAESERRYRESEAQNRAKDNFLATLSHELRTPMTSILGWIQFLRLGSYTQDELDEALETVETSARLQARLIDDMLDVSRIVLGKFQVDLQPTKVSEIVEAALTTARPNAAAHDVKITSNLAPEGEAVVAADANRMQQVIGNILSNAIKFTPAGKTIDLSLEKFETKMRICVTDQ
ncbi:MAG: hybrid sensor histidine kinase/response regulator, partial [Thermoanaerobaculia bacterium]